LFPLFLGSLFLTAACEYKKPPAFPFLGAGTDAVLYALSKEAASGILPLSGSQTFEYVFDKALEVPPDTSLELDYVLSPGDPAALWEGKAPRPLVTIAGVSWALPGDASFLGLEAAGGRFRYAVPVSGPVIGEIRVTVGESGFPGAVLEIRSLALTRRWYGFDPGEGEGLSATPFVFLDGGALVIDPPDQYRIRGGMELSLEGPGGVFQAGRVRYKYVAPEGLPAAPFRIPGGALSPAPYPLSFTGGPVLVELTAVAPRPFPGEPLPADPGLIPDYPLEAWRNPRYELFRWDRFPSVLIFDTADYGVQDKLFKRLAFFVEKAGFRGRLAPDAEIAALRGWNAHDYRAEDLARFFEAARIEDFPLSPEERELEGILLASGIIRLDGGFTPGEGAIISISRESPGYLRSRLLVHEGFHGLFFIDEDFRNFSRERWENLPSPAKRFILSYFDSQRYDRNDPWLMVNEFMAYCLQQPLSSAGWYFGEYLAGQMAATWRRRDLPPGDEASGSWPGIAEVFTREAAAFSAYVDRRWGLAAGRIRRITRDSP
jgi:hypothetical protein